MYWPIWPKKAFYPSKIPFPFLHIDTGHNFPETIAFRDELIAELNVELIVRYVQDSINQNRVKEETGKYASRNALQTVTLLDAIEEFGFDACMGAPEETKKRVGQRSASSRYGMILVNGTTKPAPGTISTVERSH